MTKSKNLREISLSVLIEVFENNKMSHIVLNNALNKNKNLTKQERSFVTRLSEGTIEKTIELDFIINKFSKINTKKMKPVIRNILRLSVYQIKYMDSIPNSAVCNEAVILTAKKGFVNLKAFVNAVLRNIIRGINDIKYPDDLSIKYSIPKWIIDLWIKDYGKKETLKILEGLNKERKTCVRCNLSKDTKQNIIDKLKQQNITVEESKYLNEALYISGYDRINEINAHNEGLIQVQDLSSMYVALKSDIKKENYVIDVCGAPGGKALHCADILNGTGFVDVRDISDKKIRLINENIERTDFNNIKAKVSDALEYDEESFEKADVVIADLPCSGLGIIGKKTDIKYKVSRKAITEVSLLQRKILENVSRYVKNGGVLIFSTCTLNKTENQDNVKWFKDNFPFEEEEVFQIIPGELDSDGFFISRFRRK